MSKTEIENNKDRIMPSSQRWTATPSPQEALEEVIDFVDRQIDHNKKLLSIFCKCIGFVISLIYSILVLFLFKDFFLNTY